MRVRVDGALGDAADARYHANYIASFISTKSIPVAENALKEDENTDPAFKKKLVGEMLKVRSRLWNSVELYHQYQIFGGHFRITSLMMYAWNVRFLGPLIEAKSFLDVFGWILWL